MLSPFNETKNGKTVLCTLCGHRCTLQPGQSGRCQVRYNRDGDIDSLTYGRLLAASVDPIEKKPLFHFKPGHKSFSIALAGCNFSCDFCQNWQISQSTPDLLKQSAKQPFTSPSQVVEAALAKGCQSISYTYTEPIVFWEYALECMRAANVAGLDNVVVSNGFGSAAAWRASQGMLSAANIDLKAFNNDFYRKICNGRLQVVLDSLKQLKQQGVWLELTTLLIPGLNDDNGELAELAAFIAQELSPDTPWHISAYHPAYKRNTSSTSRETLLRAWQAGQQAGLRYIYLGNVPALHMENTICPACSYQVITRRGFTITSNQLEAGLCPKCRQPIAGVWQ